MSSNTRSFRRTLDTRNESYDNRTSTSLLNSSSSLAYGRSYVDMIQREDKLLVSVEIPGVFKEDISLETSGRSLVVKARYREKRNNQSDDIVYLTERRREDIHRFIYMPISANLDKVEFARYKDGVLHIQIPLISYRYNDHRNIPVRGD